MGESRVMTREKTLPVISKTPAILLRLGRPAPKIKQNQRRERRILTQKSSFVNLALHRRKKKAPNKHGKIIGVGRY